MTPSWRMHAYWPAIKSVADLSGPFLLLLWGWIRWKRDPHRPSLSRWREFIGFLSLVVGSAGAVLLAAAASGYAPAGTVFEFVRYWPILHHWPLTYWPMSWMRLTLLVALAGFFLSFTNRGLTRALVAIGCLWLAVLSWTVCCMPENMDVLIDWLERVF